MKLFYSQFYELGELQSKNHFYKIINIKYTMINKFSILSNIYAKIQTKFRKNIRFKIFHFFTTF